MSPSEVDTTSEAAAKKKREKGRRVTCSLKMTMLQEFLPLSKQVTTHFKHCNKIQQPSVQLPL